MKFKKEYTNRGFEILKFKDDYSKICNLQRSSSIQDKIWLGIENAEPQIMATDAKSFGIDTKEVNGWIEYPIDQTKVFLTTRMHLTRKQSFKLAIKLIIFSLFNKI